MKKFLLAVVLLTATAVSSVNAQSLLRWGVKGGANLGKLDGTGYQDGFNLGYHLGGFVQLNLVKGFGVQGELIFSSTKTKTTDDFSEIYNTGNLEDNGKKISLNYLSIPLLANIDLGTKRLKLQLGPQFGALVSDKKVFGAAQNAFKGGEISGVAGLWLQLPIVNVSARYIIGFNDVENISSVTNTGNWKNQSIQLGVGVTL
ncbi:Outer membrane protein beta-barrel domain-containing protein [Chitinophaga jiangningensis]|uniref:Outer membrane protein beta-barrel domain-containing protein n=1 Tax=Chitinophaga jiangningensis TaxID=1419482 RepID=A0A1M6V0Y8_9BACT|nr:porin family protein [Chitinophaga jiangningensis]SHK75025.1 Outer membrane protein beta-barrel domain-containing protein [Chitinophaga jiangningensis]